MDGNNPENRKTSKRFVIELRLIILIDLFSSRQFNLVGSEWNHPTFQLLWGYNYGWYTLLNLKADFIGQLIIIVSFRVGKLNVLIVILFWFLTPLILPNVFKIRLTAQQNLFPDIDSLCIYFQI